MRVGFRMPLFAQNPDEVLHLAGACLGGDQHRVGRRHDDHVVEADDGRQALPLAVNEAAGGLDQFDPPAHRVALRVAVEHLPDGIPSAHIRPAERDREHTGPDDALAGREASQQFNLTSGFL